MRKKPLILADPYPQTLERIFAEDTWNELQEIAEVVSSDQQFMPKEQFDELLPEATAIIGQSPMPKERIQRAKNLKVIFNVEGNFYQNIDYGECFRRNIRVLNCGAVYALPVAEMALSMAIDLSRGITWEHMRFKNGTERYVLEGNTDSFLLSGSSVGIIGFGLLGKTIRRLLDPFRCTVRVYDPWLPESVIREHGSIPSSLNDLLSQSRVIFIMAGVTNENQGFLGKDAFDRIQQGSCVLLMSRAAVVDFDEFIRQVEAGRFKAATDVFPTEPMPKDHRIRQVDDFILSPHRAGGIPQAFQAIGEMVLDDLRLILQGLSPVRMQAAQPEIVNRLSSKPVS